MPWPAATGGGSAGAGQEAGRAPAGTGVDVLVPADFPDVPVDPVVALAAVEARGAVVAAGDEVADGNSLGLALRAASSLREPDEHAESPASSSTATERA